MLTGVALLTRADLVELVSRVGPVLVFLLAITVVAEISDRAGVFDVAGHWAARAGRHRTPVLWLLFVLVAVWYVVRCAKGLQYLGRGQPYPNAATWLW